MPSEYPVASNFISNSISISVDNDFVNIISAVVAATVAAVRFTAIYHIYNFISVEKIAPFRSCTHSIYLFIYSAFRFLLLRAWFASCFAGRLFFFFVIFTTSSFAFLFYNFVCIAFFCAFAFIFASYLCLNQFAIEI